MLKRVYVHILSCYLKAEWVEAGVRPAANWTVSLNLHGIQQVLVTETGRPADLELSLPNTAGTRVMQLEKERGNRKEKKPRKLSVLCSLLSY